MSLNLELGALANNEGFLLIEINLSHGVSSRCYQRNSRDLFRFFEALSGKYDVYETEWFSFLKKEGNFIFKFFGHGFQSVSFDSNLARSKYSELRAAFISSFPSLSFPLRLP